MTALLTKPHDAGAASRPPQVQVWATAIEAGVLAQAARLDPAAPWGSDATPVELVGLEEAGAQAREEFVAANLGLVGSVVGDYARSGAPVADLFQEGCLGLLTAVERFDYRRGVRFSTYALYWIRASVSSAAARQSGAVTIPVSRAEQLRAARGLESALTQDLGRPPSVAEVAVALGRTEQWTAVLLRQQGPRSLDELDDRTLERLPARPPGPAQEETCVWARQLLDTLSGFDRSVLELRLGFGRAAPTSLVAAARELGASVGRVRRAERRALEVLRGRCPRSVLAELAS